MRSHGSWWIRRTHREARPGPRLKAAERSNELAKGGNPAVLDTLARVYFTRGDLDKAIESVAPIAGVLSDKIGSRPILATGLALQAIGLAWIAAASTATVGYTSLVGPFILSGIGMGLFFAPMANVILSSVSPAEEGKASGANSAVREVGGVFGVAVLASVFSRYGGYASPETFNDGLVVATWVGAIVVAFGALAALAIPGKVKGEAVAAEPALAEAA